MTAHQSTTHPNLAEIEQRAQDAAELLKAISNENRLKILCQLVQGEKSVGELDRGIGLGQSAVSQHLAILRDRGLVKTRRASQTIYYSIDGRETQAIMDTLYRLFATPSTTGSCKETLAVAS